MQRSAVAWFAVSLALACPPVWAGGKAHEHGLMKLDVVIDGRTLALTLQTPLDSFLGFERAPRNDAERKAAADLLARLRAPGAGVPLFNTDAAAQCVLSRAEVQAAALEPGSRAATKDGHADLEANYEFSCSQPQQLRRLEVGLFDAYRRLQRIEVQVVGPQGQAKLTLKRPARNITLVR